jgi:undecaprenyl pyrophosphate phosphatase UppP
MITENSSTAELLVTGHSLFSALDSLDNSISLQLGNVTSTLLNYHTDAVQLLHATDGEECRCGFHQTTAPHERSSKSNHDHWHPPGRPVH